MSKTQPDRGDKEDVYQHTKEEGGKFALTKYPGI